MTDWTKSPLEIAREEFPFLNTHELMHIAWNYTGYPSFWQTEDGEACFRKQLREYKEKGPDVLDAEFDAAFEEIDEDE